MSSLVIKYDPDPEAMSYGWYRCPECEAQFYGGGPALHKKNCPSSGRGYEGLEYWIGDVAIRAILKRTGSLNPVDASFVRAALPVEVARVEAKGGAK